MTQFGFTKQMACIGMAISILGMAAQSGIAQQQGKPGEKPKYQKIKPKTGNWCDLAKDTSRSELSAPPANFPIPAYSGRFMGGYSRTCGLGSNTSVDIASTDNIDSVLNWYRSGLKTAGWQLQEGMPGGVGVGNISGYKDGMTCRVVLRSAGKGTNIHLSVTKKQ